MDLQSPIWLPVQAGEPGLEAEPLRQVQTRRPIRSAAGPAISAKVKEGDRQRPKALRHHAGADNPQSAYYLSFNTGYPNAYDASLSHTGSQLVHSDCSSRGCCAMTDSRSRNLFARAESFDGQKSFQFQA